MDFYSMRFMNYVNAVKYADTKLRKILKEKVDVLIEQKHYETKELYFITDGLNAVIEGKSALSKTYIFGYYLQNGPKKQFFEFSQGLLERNAEELNRLLEGDEIDKIISSTEFNEYDPMLNNFRSKIINLINTTLNYKDTLLQEIEDQYLEYIDNEVYNMK
ncbi:MAG: hypothetical protein MJ252_29150 [archaeon]|nr:hypothetical protein [archaeon]